MRLYAGPLSEAADSWNAALTALRAVSPAQDIAHIRDVCFSTALIKSNEGVSVAAMNAIEDMLSGQQDGAVTQGPHMQPFLRNLSRLLIAKAQHPSSAVRTAALRCLGGMPHDTARAEQLVALALAAQARLTDIDAEAADAAAKLLAVLGVPVALLAATGINVGGMQDEPAWRLQVGQQPFN